jgi:hypothetical protein
VEVLNNSNLCVVTFATSLSSLIYVCTVYANKAAGGYMNKVVRNWDSIVSSLIYIFK